MGGGLCDLCQEGKPVFGPEGKLIVAHRSSNVNCKHGSQNNNVAGFLVSPAFILSCMYSYFTNAKLQFMSAVFTKVISQM